MITLTGQSPTRSPDGEGGVSPFRARRHIQSPDRKYLYSQIFTDCGRKFQMAGQRRGRKSALDRARGSIPSTHCEPSLVAARPRKGGVSRFNALYRHQPRCPLRLRPVHRRRIAVLLAVAALIFVAAPPAQAGDWSEAAVVRRDLRPLVSYRAKLDGEFLVVQADHEEGWHTCAMDNKVRAKEKLAGRRSPGIDAPTEIGVAQGLELAGEWRQSPPQDFSKPELRWFTWGFEGSALFVAKVRRTGGGPARISVRGQACSETSCQNIDAALSLSLSSWNNSAGASGIDFEKLIAVREAKDDPDAQGDN